MNAGIDWRDLASVSTGNVYEFAFFCRSKGGSRDKNTLMVKDTTFNRDAGLGGLFTPDCGS